MMKVFHMYHMVNMSPWPFLMGFSALSVVLGLVKMFIFKNMISFIASICCTIFIFFLWEKDVVRESTFQGNHCSRVVEGLIYGMILFIVSEIFFFLSFFWAFFHSSLNPVVDLGSDWPPMGISPLNPFSVPLLNTVVLLASGVSITFCHQSILNQDWKKMVTSLMVTWALGLYFLTLQYFEYKMAGFSISDSVFGSVFFMSTGFHGFHVMVGTGFLLIMFIRGIKSHFSSSHHLGFECAAWYWHFVDVVWLFLFSVVYWWGC
uniref:Cytochrome c oxidase subunit 3 n=1 Tax=Tetragnatha nitens TaxID=545214 RepID=A0A0N7BLU0_9ARAC|nr:cytochrome c oxidase subunit III [Tetragnatha nitens]AKG65085.1 cytochrome c oxidase subunit III [Tetragnatha nitens]